VGLCTIGPKYYNTFGVDCVPKCSRQCGESILIARTHKHQDFKLYANNGDCALKDLWIYPKAIGKVSGIRMAR
jgi:hypothetical protein